MYLLKKIYQFLLDCLFPIQCLGGCGSYDTWLCSQCAENIMSHPLKPECPYCRKNRPLFRTCIGCSTKTALSGVIILTDYNTPNVQKLVKTLKYKYVNEIGILMGKMLAARIRQMDVRFLNQPMIIPVPLHHRRKNERGFNQAEIIAQALAEELDYPIRCDILTRSVYTPPQANLDRAERLRNLENTFKLNTSGLVLSQQNVILIDDVATTTATLSECARELKKAGVKEVWGAVIARSHK